AGQRGATRAGYRIGAPWTSASSASTTSRRATTARACSSTGCGRAASARRRRGLTCGCATPRPRTTCARATTATARRATGRSSAGSMRPSSTPTRRKSATCWRWRSAAASPCSSPAATKRRTTPRRSRRTSKARRSADGASTSAHPAMRLLLFDIDGTLLRCGPQVRVLFAEALVEVFGTAGDLDHYDFSGKTDPLIVRELMTGAGFGGDEVRERLPRMRDAYASRIEARLGPVEVIPGAGEA